MAIAWTPDSSHAKEMVKWEGQYSQFGPPGRPFEYHEFPKMLYKAFRNTQGVPNQFESCIVENADQQANMESRGFRYGQDKALEALHVNDFTVAELAANRAAQEKRMGPLAQQEAANYDNATSSHVPVIPETPIPITAKKRGRPKKAGNLE